jgi:hypothetical protein
VATNLFGLLMTFVYHKTNDIYSRIWDYRKEKQERLFRLQLVKPMEKSLDLAPQGPRPIYPPEVDPSILKICNMRIKEHHEVL